jgi:hypothetical protein
MSDPIGYDGTCIKEDWVKPPERLAVTHKQLGFYKEGDLVDIKMSYKWPWSEAVVTKGFDGKRLYVISPKHGRVAVTQMEDIRPRIMQTTIAPKWPPIVRLTEEQEAELSKLVKGVSFKDTNPKDAVGIRKVPSSVVPRAVVQEIGLGMLEGALKYGRHNYRVAGVRASVYFDAANRHLDDWWEGQDIDPDSGLSHITKALACLTVLRDAMMNDKWSDDRPPPMKNQSWMKELNEKAAALIDKIKNPKSAFTKENVK